MKIKFKNENYLEPIKSTDIKRSYRVDKLKEFYLKYPDVFLENYFDIELLEYQKLFIRLIVRDTDKRRIGRKRIMKYKVGDKVIIRRDLMIFERYGSQTFVKQMEKYKGMPATISEVFSDTYYIKEDKGENWYWTDDMFEAKDELTAEAAIKIQAEMCRSISNCKDCPICKEKKWL